MGQEVVNADEVHVTVHGESDAIRAEALSSWLPEIIARIKRTSVSRFDLDYVTNPTDGHTCRCKHHPSPDLDAAFLMIIDRIVDDVTTWGILTRYDLSRGDT